MGRRGKPEETFKTAVRIPVDILNEMDKLAEYHERDRSGEINYALRQYVDNYYEESKIKDLLDELEDDPLYDALNIKYKELKSQFNKELDRAFVEILKSDKT